MRCPYCTTEQSDESTNKLEKRSVYRDYGSAYEKSDIKQGHSYSWGKCSICGVGLVLSDTHKKVLGFNNPRINYNEPEKHFGNVSKRLSRILQGKRVFISGKSQKDLSLIKHLQGNLNTDTSNQIRYSDNINILIARRYMEHITGRKSVRDELLSVLRPGDILIIEILDFEDMLKRGNLSFLWDERISYPTIEFIQRYFCSQGMNCHDIIKIKNSDEPFSVFILIKKSLSVQQNFEAKGFELSLLREHLTKVVMTRFGYRKNVAFYGINNKVITILDIILENGYSADQIKLYDGDIVKIGSRWENLYVEDIANCCTINDISVFSFQNETSEKIVKQIQSKSKYATIMYTDSVFQP